MSTTPTDPFDDLARMALAPNGLYGARVQAQRHFDQLTEQTGALHTSVEVMRRAWDALLPERREEALDACLNAYYIQAVDIERAEEMNRLAREAGRTFLEHDDLDVINYTCFAIEGDDGVIGSGIPDDGIIGVEVALVARLIDEIELLRARLAQAGSGVTA